MEWIAFGFSFTTLAIVIYLLRADRTASNDTSKEIKRLEKIIKDHENKVDTMSSRLWLLIRMLRQHMQDGEILVDIGTANDRKLIAALQAAGIYVQFDEFPKAEMGRSKVIAEMLKGEDHG